MSVAVSKTLHTLRSLREPNLFRAESAVFAENGKYTLCVSVSPRELLKAPFCEGCVL
jgi:hypothetical protein